MIYYNQKSQVREVVYFSENSSEKITTLLAAFYPVSQILAKGTL